MAFTYNDERGRGKTKKARIVKKARYHKYKWFKMLLTFKEKVKAPFVLEDHHGFALDN